MPSTLTFAGVSIPVWPSEVASWVRDNIDPRSVFEFDRNYNFAATLGLPRPTDWLPKEITVGCLRWPLGASRWATCHLIADAATYTAVQTASLHSAGSPNATYYDPKSFFMSDGTNSLTTNLTLLTARPLTDPNPKTTTPDFWLLTLVDARWFWWQRAGSLASGDISSWATAIQAIATKMGEGSVTIPAIASAYQAPDTTRWVQNLQPLPILMDAACYAVGRRLVRKLDGTLYAQQWTDAKTANDAEFSASGRTLLAGGRQGLAELGKAVPASVTVAFNNGGTPTSVNKTLTSLSITQYGSYPGRANESATVAAEYLGTTGSTQTSYATQAATDWYGWQLPDADAMWAGVAGCTPNGYAGLIEWVYDAVGNTSWTRYQSPARQNGGAQAGFPQTATAGGFSWARPTSLTLDANGRYPGEIDTYNVVTGTWSTSIASVKLQADGGSLQLSDIRYPALFSTNDNGGTPTYVTLAIADELPTSPVTWLGGLVSTTTQKIKGAKTFRDTLTVSDTTGIGTVSLIGSSGGASATLTSTGTATTSVNLSSAIESSLGLSAGAASVSLDTTSSRGYVGTVGPFAVGSPGGYAESIGFPGTAGGGSSWIVCSGTGYLNFNSSYGAALRCSPAATGAGQLGTNGRAVFRAGVPEMSIWCASGSTYAPWAACDGDMVIEKTGGGTGNGDLTLVGGTGQIAAYAVIRINVKKHGLDQTITIGGVSYNWYGGILTPP